MAPKNWYIILAVVVVLLIIAVAAYEKGWLNDILPASWKKHKSTFVGAYGRTPGMQNCLAFSDPSQRQTYFNRCTWV
jgi:hypothetical protein